MNLETIRELDRSYYMNTFGERVPLCFTSGKGIDVTATDGRVYHDFFAGIAVNSLGYAHPVLTKALQEQAAALLHTSSVYYVENQARLAQVFVENTCIDRVFFCSTGAEANEGAIKLAKKYQMMRGRANRIEFITLRNSFHGRTLATVAATGQEKYQKPYQPLIDRFIHVDRNDCAALRAAVNENTAAIMLELIQGESGVYPLTQEFVDTAAALCREQDLVFIVDEVQTGVGRTGKLFAYEGYGIEPDIITAAKGLGGGVPIGAFGAKEHVAAAFMPGDHGTTFGGNPLSTRAGLVVLSQLLEHGLLQHVQEVGEYFQEKMEGVAASSARVREVRGKGLMLGIEFTDPIAKEVNQSLLEKGYLVGVIGDRILRIVPPLIVNKQDIDGFIEALRESLCTC